MTTVYPSTKQSEQSEFVLKQYTPRKVFICYLDVLGFKKLFERYSLPSLAIKYKQIFVEMAELPERINKEHIKHTTYSDTIILWTTDDSWECFEILCTWACSLLCAGFALMPLSGAIAYGECILEDDLVLGRPLIRAYEESKKQDWVGGRLVSGVCSPPTEFIAKGVERGFLVEWDIPIKEDKEIKHEKGWALDMTYTLARSSALNVESYGVDVPDEAKNKWIESRRFVFERLKSRSQLMVEE